MVVDNHIDRSGVKAWRHVELTDTNYLNDLFKHRKLCAMRIYNLFNKKIFLKEAS